MPGQARKINVAGREIWVDAAGNEIRDVTPNPASHENDLWALQMAAAMKGKGLIPTPNTGMMDQALAGLRMLGPVPPPKKMVGR